MRADSLARSMMNNDMTGFWKDVHKITNPNVPLATKVDGVLETQTLLKCGSATINPY